jgi:hypothetical protein
MPGSGDRRRAIFEQNEAEKYKKNTFFQKRTEEVI